MNLSKYDLQLAAMGIRQGEELSDKRFGYRVGVDFQTMTPLYFIPEQTNSETGRAFPATIHRLTRM